MTPLDFRLIAGPVFRLIAVHCVYIEESIEHLPAWFQLESLVSGYALSTVAFHTRVDEITSRFFNQAITGSISSKASDYVALLLRVNGLASAVHTNAFQMTVPGSDQYRLVNNFYPMHDNAMFDNVSHDLWQMLLSSLGDWLGDHFMQILQLN
jgi:hypothetical protein